jgi:DNA-binding NtrC family response regulator
MPDDHHSPRSPKRQRYFSPQAWAGGEITQAVLQNRVAEAATADGPVLIVGESGAGKRLAAKLIHDQTPRGGYFVDAPCGHALPELVEPHLFGGMSSPLFSPMGPPAGLIERAKLGTCFLQDVHALPARAQEMLLRYLETGEVQCLSTWFRPPPARLVAATSVELEEEVRAGRFREDLWSVLMRNTIVLPPLRERPDDILPIFTYYLDAYSYWTRRSLPTVPDSAKGQLLAHRWPGNIDELKHLAARVVLAGTTEGLLEELIRHTPFWRELVEQMWTDDEGGHDPVTCGIYLSDLGMELFMNYRETHRVCTNLITARTSARELRRDFLLAERRYEEFVAVAREW